MNSAQSSTRPPFQFPPETRWRLAEFLRPETAESVLAGLEALVTHDDNLPEFVRQEKPWREAKPVEVRRLRARAIHALEALAEVLPFDERRIMLGFAEKVQSTLQPDRKADRRSEGARMLCGWIGKVWPTHAREPANKTARRGFARSFLSACGRDHALDGHPEQLDAWLDQDAPAGYKLVQDELFWQELREKRPS